MDSYQHGVSLLGGWLPITVEVVAAAALVVMLARRPVKFYAVWLPVAAVAGVAAFAAARYYMSTEGLTSDPAPSALWWWIAALGFVVALALGSQWRTGWARRTVALIAVLATLASVGVVLNQWVGYYRTVQAAWGALTAGPVPDQVSTADLADLRGKPTTTGKVVTLTTSDAVSAFPHRTEYVYLPPVWVSTPADRPPPKLPAIMMLPGEFNTPADWMRTGNAIGVIDAYARAHGGQAPILVFPDINGSFNNDTECVDGPRGNVATHLTREVRPQVITQFGADPSSAGWGVVGWSMGGTCAIDLTVMHPDDFSAFTDIAGDLAPVSGTKSQTISRLFNGDAARWTEFDPTSVMTAHGPYRGVAGWFADVTDDAHRHAGNHGTHHYAMTAGSGLGGRDGPAGPPGTELNAARQLCTTAQHEDIDCTVHIGTGGHTWEFAENAFTGSLDWMAGRLT